CALIVCIGGPPNQMRSVYACIRKGKTKVWEMFGFFWLAGFVMARVWAPCAMNQWWTGGGPSFPSLFRVRRDPRRGSSGRFGGADEDAGSRACPEPAAPRAPHV